MIVVAIIGILAAVAIPQYQNYIAKSQVSRVMAETAAMRTVVESCLLEGIDDVEYCELGWTESNLIGEEGGADEEGKAENTGYKAQTGLTIVFAESADDDTTITAEFGRSSAQAIKEKNLVWTRDKDGIWKCGTNVDAKFKPTGCQGTVTEGTATEG